MSQLQTVLRRSIAHLDPEDREARKRVFASARSAMVRMLFSYDPPLTTSEINRKIGEFDRIVGEIESGHPSAPDADSAPPPPANDAGPPPALAAAEFAAAQNVDDRDVELHDFDDDIDDRDTEDPEPDDQDSDYYRPSLRDFVTDWMGGLSGRTIALLSAAVAAIVILLLGSAVFFSGRSTPPTPAETAAAAPAAAPAAPPAPAAAAPSAPAAPAAPAAGGGTADATSASDALALETVVLFDGRDPTVFQSPPDNPIQFSSDTGGGYVRISSSTSSTGVRLIVGRGTYQRLSGHRIRIVVVARGSQDAPAGNLRFSYQDGRSISPWIDRPLATAYQPLSGGWSVPAKRGGPDSDALTIEPGIPGDSTSADIRSVRIEILG